VAFGTMLGGCPLEGSTDSGSTAAQCEQETRPAQLHVTFEASIFEPGTSMPAATIQAGSISGGEFTRSWLPPNPALEKRETNFAILIGSLSLTDATFTGGDALKGWRDATLKAASACDGDPKCDAVAVWQRSGAQRDVLITAKTEDGTEIAQWKFRGAFVTELSMNDAGQLGNLRFAADDVGFRTLNVTSLAGDMPAIEAKLSKADAGITDASVAEFGARYLPPEAFLSALNHGAEGKTVYVEASLARCEGDRSTSVPVCVMSAREAGSGMATGRRQYSTSQQRNRGQGDYLPAHNWKIEIDGVIAGGFKEVSGLESEVEVIEYRNGDDPVTHKRPGKTKFKNITLRRGLEGDAPLLPWYKSVLGGKTDRKSGSIIYLDREGNEVLRYNFFEAWPTRWKAPELNSHSDTHIVEELEFVVEKVERT
jgi:phage tail-like protein